MSIILNIEKNRHYAKKNIKYFEVDPKVYI